MKIFVPKYRHNFPHRDNTVLTSMFVELAAQEDLDRVIDYWEYTDKAIHGAKGVRDFFTANVKTVCEHEPIKHSLEPVLRRPHVTLHGGSKLGSPECKAIFAEGAYQSGYLAARNGFNVWYGGGNTGLMGLFGEGFNDAIKQFGARPDQYLVQVVPGAFVKGVPSQDGLKPANEGLCTSCDVAIITPDFDVRLHLLNNRCAAAISNPGGSGSLEEAAGIMRMIKTGLQLTPLYLLNLQMDDEFGGGYYDLLKQHIERTIARGLENPKLIEKVCFPTSVEEIYSDLLSNLEKRGQLPEQVYAAYCEKHRAEPGRPLSRKIIADAPGLNG